jgi:DNA-directed RNA polymerase subunit alpha
LESKDVAEILGVREVLTQAGTGELSADIFADIASAVYSTDSGTTELKEVLEGWDAFSKSFTAANVLEGYSWFILGDLAKAEEILRKEKRNPWGYYHFVKTLEAQGRFSEAVPLVEEAVSKHPDMDAFRYLAVKLLCKVRRTEDAQKILGKVSSKNENSADFAFHEGLCLEAQGEYQEALEWYRKASDLEPEHAEALFRLGYLLDLHGEGDPTDEAIEAYERCLQITPVNTNALLNLSVLYEDRERYHDGLKCLETVLRYFPNHRRARLFYKDAEASTRMFYDKEQEKKADRQSQVLKIPVSDFELSVRSRNCLQKMNIQTLGDLIMKTEQELLSYKNFGETSLKEIKDMLSQKNLRLGQGLEQKLGQFPSSRNPLEATVSPEVLDRTIESLSLSVRSRRCMERLEVKSLRDLINKTEVELMSAKNFGMTSLNEIKRKLAELGLGLRS